MNRFKFLLYVILVLFLLVASRFTFRTIAASTSLCGACHETQAQYAAWKKSAHSQVPCLDCHAQPGLAGYVSSPIRAFGSIGAKLGIAKRSSGAVTSDDNCLNCHDTIADDIVVKRGVKVKHREIIDDGRRCGDCHTGIGHQVGKEISNDAFPSMDKCLDCHRSKRLKECKLCHTNKPGRGLPEKDKMGSLAHDSRWARGHSLVNSRYCWVCHDRKFCDECHEVRMPHPSNWPFLHGKQALKQSGCSDCHKQKFCDSCHEIDLPHKPGWLHGTPAKKQRDVCDRCHADKVCKACHDIHDTHLLER